MATDGTETTTEDPVGYFVDELRYHGKSERTRHAYERVLREAATFFRTERETELSDASRRDCMAWVHSIREESAPSTVATYASYLNRFYSYMTRIEAFDGNPMSLAMEEMDESIDTDPDRREISVEAMAEFVGGIAHPLDRAAVVTLLKTGVRVGELCNLDLRDVNLDDGDVRSAYDEHPRGAIADRPDSLYVASEPSRGEATNGEVRTASNKRKRSTVVPIDAELKRVLKTWLSVRPDTKSPAEPLFPGTVRWGERVTPIVIRRAVTEHAREAGWHRPGGGPEENVTPHYFRHFFTTHLRDRTGDRGIVKYLRGDVADDVIDTYTHNWGDRVRDVYEEHIYAVT